MAERRNSYARNEVKVAGAVLGEKIGPLALDENLFRRAVDGHDVLAWIGHECSLRCASVMCWRYAWRDAPVKSTHAPLISGKLTPQ